MQKLRVDMNMGANLRRLRLEHRYTQDQLVAKLHLLEVPVTRAVCSGTKPGSGISRSAHSSRCISSIAAAVTPPHKTPGEALKRFPGGFGVISLVLPGLCPLSASLPGQEQTGKPRQRERGRREYRPGHRPARIHAADIRRGDGTRAGRLFRLAAVTGRIAAVAAGWAGRTAFLRRRLYNRRIRDPQLVEENPGSDARIIRMTVRERPAVFDKDPDKPCRCRFCIGSDRLHPRRQIFTALVEINRVELGKRDAVVRKREPDIFREPDAGEPFVQEAHGQGVDALLFFQIDRHDKVGALDAGPASVEEAGALIVEAAGDAVHNAFFAP